ncbi:Hypothetical protein SCLAV_5003 [Streptomyces clavuligerus]|uniref:Uncharacterized protein n=1 Tax=Streptomyces clavuligerus TaxID=1901 RepID=E2PWZ9_STRCL|nr:Hypothetical protein SCLAV_5003 [Streptomyces clavuligerus]
MVQGISDHQGQPLTRISPLPLRTISRRIVRPFPSPVRTTDGGQPGGSDLPDPAGSDSPGTGPEMFPGTGFRLPHYSRTNCTYCNQAEKTQ